MPSFVVIALNTYIAIHSKEMEKNQFMNAEISLTKTTNKINLA